MQQMFSAQKKKPNKTKKNHEKTAIKNLRTKLKQNSDFHNTNPEMRDGKNFPVFHGE